MKFLRDVQGFRGELNDLGNEGWTVVCLEGPWHAGQRNDVFREFLGPHVTVSLEVGNAPIHCNNKD